MHIAVFRKSDIDLILSDGGYAVIWPIYVEYPNRYFGVSATIWRIGRAGGLDEVLNLSRMLSQSVGVGKLREAGFWLERGSTAVWSASSVLEGSSRHALPPTPWSRQDAELLDAPDAGGDDVHDALPSGCSAPNHQDRGAYLEAKLLEHGGP